MADYDAIHVAIDAATGFCVLLSAYAGLSIKTILSTIRLEAANDREKAAGVISALKEQFTGYHRDTAEALNIHKAEDVLQFREVGAKFTEVGTTLKRMEDKLDTKT